MTAGPHGPQGGLGGLDQSRISVVVPPGRFDWSSVDNPGRADEALGDGRHVAARVLMIAANARSRG